MQKEFENNLINKHYEWIFILAEKHKFERGELEIVACLCGGDLVDFLP